MLRTLLATTALAGVIATGAMAQDATKQQPPAAAPATDNAQPATTTGAAPADTATTASATTASADGQYLQTLGQDQYLASNLAGQSVFASEAADAPAIGEIQNFLVDQSGGIVAAVVDARLADQSRTIAVPFEQLSWAMDQNNEPRAVLTASQDQLMQAPAFGEAENQAATGAPAQPAATTSAANAPADAQTEQQTAAATDAAPAPATADKQQQAVARSEAAEAGASADSQPRTAMAGGGFPTSVGPDQFLTENIIGESVRNGPTQDSEDVGEVNDLVVASSGQLKAVVVGVGGFLGIGEKDVAIPFEQVNLSRGEDGNALIAISASKDQLDQAPKFEAEQQRMAEGANVTTQTGEAATATGAAAGSAMKETQQATGNAMQGTQQAATDAGQATERMAAGGEQRTERVATDTQAIPGVVDPNASAGNTAVAQNAPQTTTTATAPAVAVAPDATTTASTGGQTRAMVPVDPSEQLSADDLLGTTVYGPGEETVGEIGDIALNKDGGIDALIIDVGGFLGIGEKQVAVSMDNLQFMRDGGGSLFLYTQFTEDQLENAVEYEQENYAANRDQILLQQGTAPAMNAPASGTVETQQVPTQPAN